MPEEVSHLAPAWLTGEYVQEKLRIYLGEESLILEKLEIKPAVSNGENYSSVMTRINVEYSTKASKDRHATNFLVKTTFAAKDPVAHLLVHYGIYTREMDMYEQILPQMAEIGRSQLKDSRKLFAGTVNVDRERDSIIFEDLSLENYIVACRFKKLDLEHTHLVLEKLANFHAAGAALAEQKPGIFEKNFDRGFYNKHTRGYEPIMRNQLQALSRSLELNKDLKQRYQAKIDRLVERVMDYGERSVIIRPGDFVTLCHGDIWTSNVMFNYDANGHPANAIFIDFQFSVWNSPAIDLHYFFSTSILDNLRLEKQTELVQFYYYKLAEGLRKVKYSGVVPTLFEFQNQFRSRAFFSVFSTLIFEPVQMYNGKEEASLEQMMSTSEKGIRFQDSEYQAKEIQEKMKLTLPYLDHLGLLDEM